MPLYDFLCKKYHRTESRQGTDTTSVPCPVCGKDAQRVSVYHNQFISCATGPKGSTKTTGNDIPREDQDLRQDFREYEEAAAEVDYAYAKHETKTGKKVEQPDLFKVAKQRVRERSGKRLLKS